MLASFFARRHAPQPKPKRRPLITSDSSNLTAKAETGITKLSVNKPVSQSESPTSSNSDAEIRASLFKGMGWQWTSPSTSSPTRTSPPQTPLPIAKSRRTNSGLFDIDHNFPPVKSDPNPYTAEGFSSLFPKVGSPVM
jgi:hypothetical protein